MCRYLSAIVTRENVHYSDYTDRHEFLIRDLKLDDTKPLETRGWIRVEFCPENEKDYGNIKKYKLNVDESSTPIWFDEERRNQVIEILSNKIKNSIIKDDRDILIGGTYILSGKAKLKDLVNSRIIIMLGSSQVGKMLGSSQVGKMLGSSQVGKMLESSQVGEMRESSQVGKMWESSQVG